MNSFLLKIAMLVMFLLSVTFGWAALIMVFPISLWNILLGILAAFFLLRAFELADKINKLGPYAEEEEEEDIPRRPRRPEGAPEESPEEE